MHEIIGKRTPRIGHSSGHGLRLGRLFVAQILAGGLGLRALRHNARTCLIEWRRMAIPVPQRRLHDVIRRARRRCR